MKDISELVANAFQWITTVETCEFIRFTRNVCTSSALFLVHLSTTCTIKIILSRSKLRIPTLDEIYQRTYVVCRCSTSDNSTKTQTSENRLVYSIFHQEDYNEGPLYRRKFNYGSTWIDVRAFARLVTSLHCPRFFDVYTVNHPPFFPRISLVPSIVHIVTFFRRLFCTLALRRIL